MFSFEFYFVPFIISYSLVSNSILFQFFSSYNIFKIPKVPYGHFTIIMTMMTVSFISFFSVDHLNAIKESESCENVKSTQFINQHCYYCRSQVQNLLLLLFVHFQLFFFCQLRELLHKTFTFNPFGNGKWSSSSSLLPKK